MAVWVFLRAPPAAFVGMDIAITSLEDTQQKPIKIEDVATLCPTASTPKIAWGEQGYLLLSLSIIALLSLEEMRNNTTVVSTNAGTRYSPYV